MDSEEVKERVKNQGLGNSGMWGDDSLSFGFCPMNRKD